MTPTATTLSGACFLLCAVSLANALKSSGSRLAMWALVPPPAMGLIAAPLVGLLWWLAPPLFAWAFGAQWLEAGELAQALALYIGLHFVASPLGVVTMAWREQAWALRLALAGQVLFLAALALGLHWHGLRGAGWAVSAAMTVYFGWYFYRLATWPVREAAP